MTPGIIAVENSKISYRLHEYTHDDSNDAYGREAAEKMGVPEERVFKTLVVALNSKELVVGVIPVSATLSMKLVAKVAGGKKAKMADKFEVERSTGYVLGGISPLAQKKQLRTFIDSSASNYCTVYVSAGRRGLEIELRPDDLSKLTQGTIAGICQ